MSIKVLADKCLAFDRGEKDGQGKLVRAITKIGFNELPDWVEGTDYYKAAVNEGSLKPFGSSGESETVQKEQEKLQALKDEIKALEEKRDLLNSVAEVAAVPADTGNRKTK
jgi:hypothetical protein